MQPGSAPRPDARQAAPAARAARLAGTGLPARGSISHMRRVAAGEHLYHRTDPLRALYRVRSGSFKCIAMTDAGAEQITAFAFAGQWLGLDGIDDGQYRFDVIALESTLVEVVLRDGSGRPWPCNLEQLLGAQIAAQTSCVRLLGERGGARRLAACLVWLAPWLGRVESGRARLRLPMSRIDIGSFLGLRHESVSRALHELAERGLISVCGRDIVVSDWRSLLCFIRPAQEQRR